ncbi:MAG: VWA domain-containing protein [Verrucomicrobia bacterium]|nr:VWA domain-containing protein [Verrucomicrobiota bacterium]
MKIRIIPLITAWAVLTVLGAGSSQSASAEEGVALAIVYDTSGSMADPAPDGNGQKSPKYKIANRALESITRQLQAFAAKSADGAPRKIQVGLFTFNGSGTPLGTALQTASQAVLKSDLSRKHVLVITDGINTLGPDPAQTMPGIKKQAEQQQANLGIHFVAFEVNAKVFDSVKKLGATVLGASNEKQLNSQLEVIMQRKILLEDEEPPKKN